MAAVPGRLTAVFLVAAILAVRVTVAAPLPVNALARATLELSGRALGWWRGPAAALWRFVGLVLAVDVVVAHPVGRDARGVSALELRGAARRRRAVLLVTSIATVVLTVAHEVGRDAAAAGAGKLQRSTGNVT